MKPKTLRALYLAVALLAGLASIPAYGQAKPWLDVLIGRRLTVSGTPVPQRTNLELGTGMVATDDPAHDRTILTSSAGAGTGAMIVSTQSALKALSAINLTDGQLVTVKATNKTWTWAATSGAGFAGDDTTSAQLTETLTASAGRFYPSDGAPVVDTLAALRAATGSIQTLVHVRSFSVLGDGGGGQFARKTGTITDDGGVEIQPPTAAFHFERVFSGDLYATWYGVHGDGKFLTDGVTTAASATFTSATANFTAADTGKKLIARTPTGLAAGTISSSGATLNGTGTNVAVDMPIIVDTGGGVGQPLSGGVIFSNGQFLVAQFILTATQQMQLVRSPSPAITTKAYYTETQKEATLTFSSSTAVTMNSVATVSLSAVQAFYASDSTTPLDNAIKAALAMGVQKVILPTGYIGVSANLTYTDAKHLTIEGTGISKTVLVDLRKASTYYTTGPSGMLSFYGSSASTPGEDVHIRNVSYEGSVPALGMGHSSTPGVGNGSGRRIGFFMQHMVRSSYRVGGGIVVGANRFGARDEHAYVDGQSDDFTFEDGCDIVGNNNVSINCNGGFNGAGAPQPERLKIIHPRATGILVSASTYTIDHADCSPGGLPIEGGITVDKIGHGIIDTPLIHDYTLGSGVGMIDVFGNLRTDSSLTILNPTFARNIGPWHTGGGAAAIHLSNFGGLVKISGVVTKDDQSSGVGGREIFIEGANTGQIQIEGGHYNGGTNISIGVEVAAGVPDGAVTIAPEQRYGTSLTTRWKLGAALGALDTGDVL